jgi:hypothetical protein
VQKDQDVVDLPDGTQVRAWRAGRRALQRRRRRRAGDDAVADAGHVPAGVQATVSVAGTQTTTTQHFSGWGMPVEHRHAAAVNAADGARGGTPAAGIEVAWPRPGVSSSVRGGVELSAALTPAAAAR